MALQEIRRWLNNAITLHRDIQHPRPSVTIRCVQIGVGSGFWGTENGGKVDPFGNRISHQRIGIDCGFLFPKMLLQQNGELPHTASDRQYHGHCVH